jgi:poly-beta-1,6-N-acetyl-D-glucosamine synthase
VLTVVVAVLSLGINSTCWGLLGVTRWFAERRAPVDRGPVPAREAVAILIAARNEQSVIERTLARATRQVPPSQIHVVSDASTDRTAELVRASGANVLELTPNRGKAAALAAGIEHFDLCRAYEVIVIVDADTELSDDYLDSGLKLFEDLDVAVVAGMVHTMWRLGDLPVRGRILLTYRERFYLLAQYMLKFGQGWAPIDAVIIAPGCASMYRAAALSQLQVDAPGLVIEDFNMSFATHRQRLGRIAFHPRAAVAYTQDPTYLRDYRRQVSRWALGYWQTVLRSRWRRRKFDLALGLLSAEVVTSCLVFVLVVVALLTSLVGAFVSRADVVSPHIAVEVALGLAAPDLLISLVIATARRQPAFVMWALAFPFLRVLDSALNLRSLVQAVTTRSSGRWVSPVRQAQTAVGSDGTEARRAGRRALVLRSSGVMLSVAVIAVVIAATYSTLRGDQVANCARPAPPSSRAAERREADAVSAVMAYTSYISQGSAGKPEVALTFDDGPGPYTPQVLAVLKRFHVPATFFVIGQQVHYFGKYLSDELAQQVVIGDHTLTHPYLTKKSPAGQRRQIQGQVRTIEACGAPYPHLFRPPYGGFNKATLDLLKRDRMLMVLWSVDTKDWTRPGVSAIVHNALATAHAGSIILMHDAGGPRNETVAALPKIIEGLRARHLRLVTIPQLLLDDPPPRGQPAPHSLAGNG